MKSLSAWAMSKPGPLSRTKKVVVPFVSLTPNSICALSQFAGVFPGVAEQVFQDFPEEFCITLNLNPIGNNELLPAGGVRAFSVEQPRRLL